MKLDKVTLVAVSSVKLDETIEAMQKSMKDVQYGQVLLISHEKPTNLPAAINFKACRKMNSIDAYNWFMVFELTKYIETDFALVVQHDGHVLNPNLWTDEFLNYDYIGAPWPMNTFFDGSGAEVRVGNGGFSLRSKKLLGVFSRLKLTFDNDVTSFPSEDAVICVYCRRELEDYGINFAPVDVASRFSREFNCSDSSQETFGFHLNPGGKVAKLKILRTNFKQKIKTIIKKFVPRFIINKSKALFLENVRRGLDEK